MSSNDWYGTVNTDNIETVAGLLREYLEGKQYTTVHCYEYRGWKPEVRIHQRLEGSRDGKNITLHRHHEGHAQIVICDTYGVGGLSTTRTEPGYDGEFNAPYVHFEWGHTIEITQRAPNGLLFHTVYRVE